MTVSWLLIYLVIGWVVRITMVPVILRRDLAPGASIAWLGVIFLHPLIGLTLYLLFGETRLGPGRIKEHQDLMAHFRSSQPRPGLPAQSPPIIRPPELPLPYEPMVLQAQHISMMPVVGGNSVEFINPIEKVIQGLVADINAATSRVHLLYFNFAHDASGEPVALALEAAARRGVACRVLVDAVAGRAFFHRSGLAGRLQRAGVEVAAALPANLIARRLPRMDLRNHRKLAVVDDRIAYAGSHNLINADYGGSRAGPWVDLSGRFTGPIVNQLAMVFAEDWAFQTGQILEIAPVQPPDLSQNLAMQAVPTGPSHPSKTYRRLLLAAIQASRRQLILTTPYFVPDEPTIIALMMAADRGVEVSLILPKNPDHFFTAAAGRAHIARLLEAGISIFLYRPGLLHAKTATVDDAFCLFGSANLDVRSFQLNFELSLLLYGRDVTSQLRAIQNGFLAVSDRIEATQWSARPIVRQYADRAVSLLSPLL